MDEMTGFGIFITAAAFLIIVGRIYLEVREGKLIWTGGVMLATAFLVSLAAIAITATRTTSDDLYLRLAVLAGCAALVGGAYFLGRKGKG